MQVLLPLVFYLFGSVSQIFFAEFYSSPQHICYILKERRGYFSFNQKTSGNRAFIKIKASQNSPFAECHQILKLVVLPSKPLHTMLFSALEVAAKLENEGALVTQRQRQMLWGAVGSLYGLRGSAAKQMGAPAEDATLLF